MHLLLLFVNFWGQLEAMSILHGNEKPTEHVNSIFKNRRSVIYCDDLTSCPSHYDYCSDYNECSKCGENEHWSGHSCVYCAYPDTWDKNGEHCRHAYDYYKDYDDGYWLIWTVVGVFVVILIGASVTFYRVTQTQKQAETSPVIFQAAGQGVRKRRFGVVHFPRKFTKGPRRWSAPSSEAPSKIPYTLHKQRRKTNFIQTKQN